VAAEDAACAALAGGGWTVLARRVRTAAGEVDVVAEKAGLVAFIEVKRSATLAGAAHVLSPRPRGRLMRGAEILLGEHPGWGLEGARFDVMLVDAQGTVRRIADAFRLETSDP